MRKRSIVNFTNFGWLIRERLAVTLRHELDYMKSKKYKINHML